MRVAVFGGSFDPVHLGHLWMAELSQEAMQLDEVIFLPAATSPLKPHGPVATNDQRLMMLRLAISGQTSMSIDTRELDRGGTSYTIDTIKELQSERPADQLFLLMGTDAFNSLDRWKEPVELLSLVTPIVLRRGGEGEPDWELCQRLVGHDRTNEIRAAALQLPIIELSSGELRDRISKGMSIRFRVPRPVEAYIEAERLYRG